AVRHDLTSLPARNHGRQDDSQNHRTYQTGSAQGHLFEGEGFQTPTDQRFCINSISMKLISSD
ncbi:peptide-methionine (R)-S-oxide reductase, partial [Kocuria marina]|uniref:peptide-methionine (R)-S-oxide reductase n=1 Tax=Kocuria marina TaxID=223184 RepID=UPI00382B0E12